MFQAGPLGHLRISPGVSSMRAPPCASPGTQRLWLAKCYTWFYQSTPSAYNSHWVPVSINLLPKFSRQFHPRLLTHRPPEESGALTFTHKMARTHFWSLGAVFVGAGGILWITCSNFHFLQVPAELKRPFFSSQKPTSGKKKKRVKLKKKEFFSFSEKN